MEKSLQHLVLYDGTCGLCDRTVQILLKIDKNQIFAFAPLNGPTATEILKEFPHIKIVDSSILIEDFETKQKNIYTEASSVFRILWLVGRPWKLLGWLFFLPPFLFNWEYRLIARHRYSLVARSCFLPQKNQKNRFLP